MFFYVLVRYDVIGFLTSNNRLFLEDLLEKFENSMHEIDYILNILLY